MVKRKQESVGTTDGALRGIKVGHGPAKGWRLQKPSGGRTFFATRMSVFHTGDETFAVFKVLKPPISDEE